MVVTSEAVEALARDATPRVLLLIEDDEQHATVRRAWEDAGFAVEVVASTRDALACLKAMTGPSLVVIEDRLYRPVPR